MIFLCILIKMINTYYVCNSSYVFQFSFWQIFMMSKKKTLQILKVIMNFKYQPKFVWYLSSDDIFGLFVGHWRLQVVPIYMTFQFWYFGLFVGHWRLRVVHISQTMDSKPWHGYANNAMSLDKKYCIYFILRATIDKFLFIENI